MSKVTRRRALVGMILPAFVVTALPASAASVAAEPDAMAQADLYGQGYVNGLAQQRGSTGDELSVSYHEGWEAGRRTVEAEWGDAYQHGRQSGLFEAERINTPAAVVAGALYDFMGYLTTREEPVTASRNHTVYALMDAYRAWAKERGIYDTTGADVAHWSERLEPFPNVQAATPRYRSEPIGEGEEEGRSSLVMPAPPENRPWVSWQFVFDGKTYGDYAYLGPAELADSGAHEAMKRHGRAHYAQLLEALGRTPVAGRTPRIIGMSSVYREPTV